jgi:Tfp pilus assembly protein PilO
MKQKYLIFSLAMVLVAVLFFVISGSMIGGKVSKIDDLDNKIKIAQEKLNSAKVMDQQLSQFSIIIENSLTTQKTFSPMEINSFVKNLANLADQNKIGVLAIYPKEIQSKVNVVEQQYIMELNTTYVQLGQFLGNIEAIDNIVKINTLDIMPLTETDSSKKKTAETVNTGPRIARYKVSLELSVFKVQKES